MMKHFSAVAASSVSETGSPQTPRNAPPCIEQHAPRPLRRKTIEADLHRPQLRETRQGKQHGGAGKNWSLFFKATSSIIGPNDTVIIPKHSRKSDWEVELAVVIGKKVSYVSEAQAMDYIAGYCLHNDYSEREWQLERGGQWVKGKSCDTFWRHSGRSWRPAMRSSGSLTNSISG